VDKHPTALATARTIIFSEGNETVQSVCAVSQGWLANFTEAHLGFTPNIRRPTHRA
jgi:hypothetical protein